MQKLQRQAGKILKRAPNDAEVGGLLAEFENGDLQLKTLIENIKIFRDSWTELVQRASGLAVDFDGIYQYLPGVEDVAYRPTRKDQLTKAAAFKDSMNELRNVLVQELESVERKINAPAKDARKSIEIFRKFCKRREDKKLDWERYKSRTDALERNGTKSERDARALQKHHIDLDISQKSYAEADALIKANLPPIIQAIQRLIPRLIIQHSIIANTMFGHFYTSMHDFCQQHGYNMPGEEWKQIQNSFDERFTQVRTHVETIDCIQKGKAVRQPFYSRQDSLQTQSTNHRKPAGLSRTGTLPPPSASATGNIPSPPSVDQFSRPTSHNAYNRPSPPASVVSAKTAPDYLNSSNGPKQAYSRTPSIASTSALATPLARFHSASSSQSLTPSVAAAAAKKKAPPPPPPKKPALPSRPKQEDIVVAQYAFVAQGEGDLGFKVGDRIKVIKRTDSTDDWWEGEFGGQRGSFPANYCKPA